MFGKKKYYIELYGKKYEFSAYNFGKKHGMDEMARNVVWFLHNPNSKSLEELEKYVRGYLLVD